MAVRHRPTRDELHRLYVLEGHSLADIAAAFGLTRQRISQLMRDLELPVRDRGVARRLALDKGKVARKYHNADGSSRTVVLRNTAVSAGFFRSWTPQMAYVL